MLFSKIFIPFLFFPSSTFKYMIFLFQKNGAPNLMVSLHTC